MIYDGKEMEKETAFEVAKLMVTAARTAPKGRGIDNIETRILDGEDKDRLAVEMREIAEQTGESFFARDANNVDASPYVVMIGVRNKPNQLTNCGFCGLGTCGGAREVGANCAFNITDLGIACGSAVAVASDNRVDSRIMFSAGKAATKIGIFPDSVRVCYGIPISISSKSPYFDRG